MDRLIRIRSAVHWVGVILLVSVAGLTACSDDPVSDLDPDPEPGPLPASEVEISGAVTGPDGLNAASVDSLTAAVSVDGETPLAGVSVDIYDLGAYADAPTSTDPLTTTTTDQSGAYTAEELPEDTDLLVRIEETDPALEAIVRAPDDGATVDVSSATTLAAAYHAPGIASGTLPTAAELDDTIGTAASALETLDASSLLSALQSLIPDTFGDGFPGDLPPELQVIVDALDGVDVAVCELVALETTSGYPTDEIRIDGLDEDFGDEPWGWLYDASIENPEDDERVWVFAERTSDDEGVLVLPLHPEEPMAGGEARLILVAEEEALSCPPVDVTIEPLEPAPGTFESMVDDMEALFVEAAGRFNADPEELRTQAIGDLAEDEVYLALIAGGLQVIDGPNYPNNLRARLAGDVGEPLEGEAFDVWEALAAHTGYDATFAGMADALSSGGQGGLVAQQTGVTDCLGEPRNISTPAELDCWMGVQDAFAGLEELRGTMNDFSERILVAVANGSAQGKVLLDQFETLRQWTEMMADGLDSAMPSELLPINVIVSQAEYKEDENAPDGWTAEVAAWGSDWDADVLLTLSVATIGIPIGRATRQLRRARQADDAIDAAIDQATGDILGQLSDMELGVISFDQILYGPVDVDPNRENEETYFEWELNTLDSESGRAPFSFVEGDESQYQPKAVGRSELRVRTRGGDVFQGQPTVGTEELLAEALEIEILTEDGDPAPNLVRVDSSDDYEVTLVAEVSNLSDDENRHVEWTFDSDPGAAFFTTSGAFDEIITFTADPQDGIDQYILRAEAATREGLRADNDPTRATFVGITTEEEDLIIEPGVARAEPDETIQFLALDPESDSPVDVTWSADAGTITSAGWFTMPSDQSTGIVTITAEATDDSGRSATAQVTFPCASAELTLTSEAFTYESETLGAIWNADLGVPLAQASSWIVNAPEEDGFRLLLSMITNISDDGEWTRDLTFTVPPIGQPIDGQWSIELYLTDGDEWVTRFYDSLGPDATPVMNPVPLTIERTLVTVDGREIPEYSGTFEGPVGRFYEDADGIIQFETVIVEGEFSGIRYGDDSCIIFQDAQF